MNRMLALLPDDYKPNFILHGLYLRCLPIQVRSHLLQEKISNPRALALKADKLFQSRISSPVNLLAEQFKEAQVSAVATKTRPFPASRRSQTPASSPRSSVPPGSCWYHRNMVTKLSIAGNPVQNRKTSSPAGGTPFPTCQFLRRTP